MWPVIPTSLLLEVLGAVILVLPDIPLFVRRLPSKLNEARQSLKSPPYRVEKGKDEGFRRLLDLIDENTDRVEYKENIQMISKSTFRTGTEQVYLGSRVGGIQVTQINVLEKWIDDEINRYYGVRLRFIGLLTLLSGVFIQLLQFYQP